MRFLGIEKIIDLMSKIIMHEDIITFNTNLSSGYPFSIHMAGISYCDGTYRISRKNSPFYVFEYIERGSGYLYINDNKFQPEAGDVYIIPCGSDHEYGSSCDNPWVKYWFNVSGSLVRNLLSTYQLNDTCIFKNYPLKDTFVKGISKLHKKQADAFRFGGPKIILEIILKLAVHREYLKEEKFISPAAQKLRLYLDGKVFTVPPTLNAMCEHIQLSPAQTNRIFKKFFGKTPYQYLLDLKMAAARELLTSSFKSIKDIAFSLGFSDEYYFSNIFKKKNGLAPRNYRNQKSRN